MITDLIIAASGLNAETVQAAVPPACRREASAEVGVRRDGGDALIEVGAGSFRAHARHLVPAFSALSARPCAFRFEISVWISHTWSPWIATATIGAAEFPPLPASVEGLETQVDWWMAPRPVERARLRVRVRADDPDALLAAPWLVTLSACDLGPLDESWSLGPGSARPVADGVRRPSVRLDVPPLSQMEASPDLGPRICSPTSVAMVLGYWGAPATVTDLAAEMVHPALDLYGIWPAAIAAAARRGVLGYLLRFPDWSSAAWCLERGIPLIASVRYTAGELAGAAVTETPGHLLVLTGYEGGDVLVNDPAARSAAAAPRRYRRAELARVWLERAGVGYVLFKESGAAVLPDYR